MDLRKLLFSLLLLLPMMGRAEIVDTAKVVTPLPQGVAGGEAFANGRNAGLWTRAVHSVWKEMAFAGVPLTLGNLALRPSREGFRQNYDEADPRTQLVNNFSTSVDNYTQYVPVVAATIMNMAGVKGHSNRLRYLGTAAGAYIIEAGLTNLLKYTVKEMRPDGSTDNSWPSGHSATVFAGATLIHHEYGMTRSPWYSVGAYTVATGTAALRVMNNRHWVTDVIAGAGIGILSTEAAYAIADFFFKDKGIIMPYRDDNADILLHPSFIGLSENFGVIKHSVRIGGKDFRFGFPVGVSMEGAYLINKYVGVGGRLMLETSSSSSEQMASSYQGWQTSFSYCVGPYFRYPLSSRFALGTKLLIGREHNTDLVDDTTDECLSIGKCMKYGTGASLTFAYKNLYQWAVFCDYDLSPRKYTLGNYTVNKAWHSVMLGLRLNVGF